MGVRLSVRISPWYTHPVDVISGDSCMSSGVGRLVGRRVGCCGLFGPGGGGGVRVRCGCSLRLRVVGYPYSTGSACSSLRSSSCGLHGEADCVLRVVPCVVSRGTAFRARPRHSCIPWHVLL